MMIRCVDKCPAGTSLLDNGIDCLGNDNRLTLGLSIGIPVFIVVIVVIIVIVCCCKKNKKK